MVISEERKKAFVVFASTYEAAVNHLTLEQMGELFLKMGRYSLNGDDVHSDTPMVDVILKMTIPNMDAAERRHQAAIENGKKGKDNGGGIGAPRKGETKEEYQARLLEWKKSQEVSNNPQEPLNNNTNINTDRKINTDNDIEIKKDTDIEIKKDIETNKEINDNTNVEVISDSISTNSLSFDFSKLEGEETDQGEGPRQERPRQEVISSFNGQEEGRDQEGEDDSDPSDPPVWLTYDPNYIPQPIDDGWTPPPPELQRNEVIISNRTDDDDPPIILDGGTPLDLIEQTPAPPKPKSRREELNDLIEHSVASAAECKIQGGKMPDYMPFLFQARDAYMELHYCEQDKAQEEITWKYHCMKDDLKRKKEIEKLTRKPL